MTETPLLSIVIPTRNRYEYLAKLLQALLGMEPGDFEVIVHDNSDDNAEYARLCGSLVDRRLRYFFDPSVMSITCNFERAVSLAAGQFVCMIGDDDGVTPHILGLARWLQSEGLDAAVADVPTYLWPGVSSSLDGAQAAGVLRIPRYSGNVDVIAGAGALDDVLRSGGIRIGRLPSVYQNVVSRRALERLKSHAGTYFPGPSPDMANAVGLSAVIDRFARVGFPVVISGACPGSGAAQGAGHRHEGELADKTFLPSDTVQLWPAQVPFYFSGPTLWAATLMRALAATGRGEMIARLRWDRLYAACVVFNPRYRARVAEVRVKQPALVSSSALLWATGWIWWQRAKALTGNVTQMMSGLIRSDGARVVGVSDIGAAIACVTQRFRKAPWSASS